MDGTVVGWVSGAIMVIVIVIGTTYGCTRTNQQYYDMAHNCIASGGTFIPVHNGNGGDAICISSTSQTKGN